ncbi:MAG TPA: NAD(P)-dependent oxidoreductase [Chloroflexota bacterium]|nr:NAD(P)-dependent oxidoreductase [Chloroflexota bacterium]
MRVGLLGLGVMGAGMAGKLLDHGHGLTVYNRTRARAEALASRGARVADTPREAAEAAEAVITMVSNDEALREVAEGSDGFLAGLNAGALLLQMSTIGPDTTDWLADQAAERGASMVDGPVLGSLPEAAEGKLWVLAGADAAVLERAQPVLSSVSQTVYHIGGIGQGTRIKLCSNLVGGGLVAALAEGMALLDAEGIDPNLYIRILQETNLPSRLWLGRANLIAKRDFAPRFSLDNMAKDLRLALELGQAHGLSLSQTEASIASLQRGAAVVGGGQDMAASFEGARRTAKSDGHP